MMDEIDRQQLYNTAWKHWGANANMDICIEESLEFIHAVLKARRTGSTYTPEVIEELADMCICIEQIKTRTKRLPYDVREYSQKRLQKNMWDDQVMVIKAEKMHDLEPELSANDIQWDNVIIRIAKFIEAVIETRMNGVVFSHAVSETLAYVCIYIEQIKTRLKGYPRSSKNHFVGDNGTEWDTVMEIKEVKLEQLKSRLFDSLDKKYPDLGDSVMERCR